MANLKTNWLIASITAIILLLGAFIVVDAMEKKSTIQELNKQDNVDWYYKGGPTDDILLATNWDTAGPSEDCGEPGDLPCSIPGPENPLAFQNHLNMLGESGVDSASPTKRSGSAG